MEIKTMHRLTMVCLFTAVVANTSLPPQSAQSTIANSAPYSQDGALKQPSVSFAYTMTTATTVWHAPSFPTSSSLPACTDNICPNSDGKTCIDSLGNVYGVLCNQRMTGVAITSSGKERLLLEREAEDIAARSYTGSLDACTASCDDFDKQFCTGVGYQQGVCTIFDTIAGTVPQVGAIACVRQT